jgi:hypothetical protein
LVPTATLAPTQPPKKEVFSFRYSYYYPDLGGVNCLTWDESKGTCVSLMASGKAWKDYVNKAVACPGWLPMYTVIRVVSPSELIGDWVCMDRGQGIERDMLDFLHKPPQRLPWFTKIQAEIIRPSG